MTRRIALVGFDPISRNDAPWDDPTWEIWGINGGHLLRGCHNRPDGSFRADAWFQIHPPFACDPAELDWLRCLDAGKYSVPTYVRPEDMAYWAQQYPHASALDLFRPYPIDAIRKTFGTNWLVNSFCLMAALALLDGADELAFFGTECCGIGRELAVERCGITYWMGVAAAGNVRVFTSERSTLAPWTKIYGFDYWDEATEAADRTERSLRDDSLLLNAVNLDTKAAVQAAREKVDAGKPSTS